MRPRREQVDHLNVSTYHCTSRCVRRAFLLSKSEDHLTARKPWIESRLRTLVEIFAVEIDTFSIMDNHLHLVLTIRPDIAAAWSDQEVAERWLAYLPPVAGGMRRDATEKDIEKLLKDSAKIGRCRLRLCSLSEFHKAIKEPLARLVNREEGATGFFWEGRFKSRRVLDRAGILSVMAYVDLNPIRASLAKTPEESHFTGIRHRVLERETAMNRLSECERADLLAEADQRSGWQKGCVTFPREPVPSFLTPIADAPDRRGLFGDLTLDEYLAVVRHIGRVVRRRRRRRIPKKLAPVFARLDVDIGSFYEQISSMAKWFGSVIGQEAARVLEAARCRRTRLVSALRLDT